MNLDDEAKRLEAYLSKLMYTLNYQTSDDPVSLLPIGQIRLLRALHSGPKTVTDIADLLNVSPSSASQLITRLADGKYVDRFEDAKDRRIRMIQLTDKGAQLIEQRHAKRTKHARLLLDGLGEERSRRLLDLLSEVSPICSQITAKSKPTVEDVSANSTEEPLS